MRNVPRPVYPHLVVKKLPLFVVVDVTLVFLRVRVPGEDVIPNRTVTLTLAPMVPLVLRVSIMGPVASKLGLTPCLSAAWQLPKQNLLKPICSVRVGRAVHDTIIKQSFFFHDQFS